ncbi:hypothetical protein B0H17DRAFT_911748, partial [Mycena rosella]
LLKMKGHNSQCPCHMCAIIGIKAPNNHLYVPLHCPTGTQYDPLNLPLCQHNMLMAQAHLVKNATNDAEEKQCSQEYRIKGVPLLSTLSLLSIPHSFPYNFMHLIWENVIKTLILLWAGEHKGIDEGTGDYHLGLTVLEAIRAAGKVSGDTIPSCFGPQIPGIVKERYYFIADMRAMGAVWVMALGPILLHQQFKNLVYYIHFVLLVQLLHLCLQFEISTADINTIETGMASWVQEFEKCILLLINS